MGLKCDKWINARGYFKSEYDMNIMVKTYICLYF